MSKSIQGVRYTDRLHQAVDAVMRPESFAIGANRRRNGRNSLSDRRGNYGGGAGASDLGVLVSVPSGGYGPAVWRAITVNPDGTWTAAGEEVPVIVPLLK